FLLIDSQLKYPALSRFVKELLLNRNQIHHEYLSAQEVGQLVVDVRLQALLYLLMVRALLLRSFDRKMATDVLIDFHDVILSPDLFHPTGIRSHRRLSLFYY